MMSNLIQSFMEMFLRAFSQAFDIFIIAVTIACLITLLGQRYRKP